MSSRAASIAASLAGHTHERNPCLQDEHNRRRRGSKCLRVYAQAATGYSYSREDGVVVIPVGTLGP